MAGTFKKTGFVTYHAMPLPVVDYCECLFPEPEPDIYLQTMMCMSCGKIIKKKELPGLPPDCIF